MTTPQELTKINEHVIKEFRENGGRVGGMFEGAPLALVHHVGARSGTERIAPLVYLEDDGRLFIFASNGGDPKHPAWYHNLVAKPRTTVEIGTETFPVTATVITGAERDAIYATQSTVAPQFAEYQSKTARVIPVVELVRDPS
ncbi:deazaflavin-dependent oxidoreductase (nitroreductase family) [Actinoalloteichus hoggarensis]|uniref:Deazaflavin-dependent nitroreductase n=1 Tax=Actinoalloteichus hoggarensis TaxID=1470176 RepID=A0A221W4F8_9PSEU|nr:nitroreductase family deazaflavin-dependent oxidoreductase [Actinoalloteichus hoggarensis]ASO20728.1 Deazaflavin-dependent nitroreductase [Actinoalloteichus hoggarensis]MBB5920658.1 deazaflavin-dependent oxidoreductase (nitroreductase family) [Actinoalloteichus hoggarensis]